MALVLQDCTFYGSALPEPFIHNELETLLQKEKLLPRNTGAEGKALQAQWDVLRQKLRALGEHGGALRVANHVLEPLCRHLGYAEMSREPTVATRQGEEDGGSLMKTADGKRLRAWSVDLGMDLDAPNRRGRAYRFSPTQIAHRVLLAKGERLGLLTDGMELRLLVSDPARRDSQIVIRLDRTNGWRGARSLPDSYRLLLALASPAGVEKLPELIDKARLNQTEVTARLREQARLAVEGFVQEVLDHPENKSALARREDSRALAVQLWQEGLVLVYRLLFTFKLESSSDPARSFSFASTTLWRRTYSPNTALARLASEVLHKGAETGRLLEDGLRSLFRLFEHGLSSSELKVSPLDGLLFGAGGMPLLEELRWGERAVALLLDRLLWTPGDGKTGRQRVHYGALDVEELGRVYEALLELEPGIATQPMCRLRRGDLEVVVPRAQRPAESTASSGTAVRWVEDLEPRQFFLRVGLGRKASGSYYTPHPFVSFLVQETLGHEVERRSPQDDPQPAEILKLKVLDPAMGSGHFLVEACRFLGDKLYEACRQCDEYASAAEERAERLQGAQREEALREVARWQGRLEALPDPNRELVAYLPSRAREGSESGTSLSRAQALCRRLVAVHCLYGVDKNPLAVELAKVALWLESFSEGLPLTFLDHRLLCGDSITGPMFENLLFKPGSGEPVGGLFVQRLVPRLEEALNEALTHVSALEASVGKSIPDIEHKRVAKDRLDQSLLPFRLLARAWAGGAMLGPGSSDDQAYEEMLGAVANGEDINHFIKSHPSISNMINIGGGGLGLSDDLELPEVFYPEGNVRVRCGFDAIIGNPPWDALQPLAKEFFAGFDLSIIDAPTRLERGEIEKRLTSDAKIKYAYGEYIAQFEKVKQLISHCYSHVNREAGNRPSGAVTDIWQVFAELSLRLTREKGKVGLVLPSAFHANQSATGIRTLYLKRAELQYCYSFENVKKLFNIDSRFKFAVIVAQKHNQGTSSFHCAFYLHELQWLFEQHGSLRYTLDFVLKTGGDYLSLLELRSFRDVEVANICFKANHLLGNLLPRVHMRLGPEIDMSKGAKFFTSARSVLKETEDPRNPATSNHLQKKGVLTLHEGKTFHQYDDRWEERPRYLVKLDNISDKHSWLQAARYYRLAFRDIARSTDERTGIFCLLPPGFLFGNKAPCERQPGKRPSASALFLLAYANSFTFDFILRCKVQATVNLFILEGCPLPALDPKGPIARALAHCALRLSANHEGYRALWEEQLGSTWREKDRPPFSWPVLPDEDSRWKVRAAIDALVADAYGLDREQYQHVLSSFSHASYPRAPELCLAAFDELRFTGAEAFARRHDPYWDFALNQQLPKPVIDFPGLPQELFSETSYDAEPEPVPLATENEDESPPAPKPVRKRAASKRPRR